MKRGSDILIGALVLIGALYVRNLDPVPIQQLRNLAFDTYQRLAPRAWSPEFPVRIAAIDESSLDQLGQWPWSRATLARITDRLTELGAAAIAFDVIFAEPDRTAPKALIENLPEGPDYDAARAEIAQLPDPDRLFAQSLARAPAILAFAYLDTPEDQENYPIPEKFGVAVIGAADHPPEDYVVGASRAVTPLPELMAAAPGLGEVHAGIPDFDGVIRRIPMLAAIGGRLYTNLAAESLRLALGGQTAQVKMSSGSGEFGAGEVAGIAKMRIGEAIIPVNARGELLLHDSGHVAERYFPVADVLRPDFDAGMVSGRIILIGATVEGLKDIRTTPNTPFTPGVTIHAQVLEQILSGTYLNRPYWAGLAEGGFLLGFGAVLLVALRRRSAIPGLAVALMALALAVSGSWWAFRAKGFLFDPVYPALVVAVLFLGGTLVNFLRTEREKRQVRNAFSRYLSPVLVDQLSEHPEQLKLGGEMRDLTLMFSDIRGFTKISESLDPQALTQFINSYLTPMTGIIQANEGTIDKYIGDCVMAFWNAPLDVAQHPRKAILAAYAMRDGLTRINAKMRQEAAAGSGRAIELRAGIGLNTGPCCVGNMGSDQRFDYSVLGDAVNIASRLEALSQSYGVDLVIGEETALAAPDLALLEIDSVRVKGKVRPIRIFTGLGGDGPAQAPEFKSLAARHATFLAAYRGMDWGQAEAALAECRALAPATLAGYYPIMAHRIEEFRREPPPSDWDGVYVATSKSG